MRYLFLLVGIAIVLILYRCQAEPDPDLMTIVDDDSLTVMIEKRIAEKKRLDEMRQELFSGHLGRAIERYRPIIKKYSKHYGMDWRLIVAQIIQESGFREQARSRVGAHGLMQIMPRTAREISNELDIEYIMKSPRENITAGIYHLRKQFRHFPEAEYPDRTRLALASYNAGAGRVFDAQDIAEYYRLSPNKWKTVHPYLKKLKKSDWELHLQVWPEGRPRFGYFYGYVETINYANRIWSLYLSYQKIL
jgi:membrane-bound lytic murein transglycosylase F